MAITPAHHIDEDELMSLRSAAKTDDDDADRDLEEMSRALLSRAAELQGVYVLSPEALDWATSLEGAAGRMEQTFGALAEDIRRDVAVLALRPGEETVVEALRKQAALVDARRADAEELAAATRRLQEKDLRRLAATEHLVHPGLPGILKYVAGDIDSSLEDGYVPTPEELAVAAVMESEVVGMEERMARLAGRLRRGAAAFAARPGEEALVAALERQAANVDAVHATVEAFKASVRRYQAAGCSPPAGM